MYVVIFRAELDEVDQAYAEMASRMRDLALGEYGCLEFTSCTEGNRKIALSYWKNKKDIDEWKSNLEHRRAQELGQTKWYKSYQVQIVEILKEYGAVDA